MDHILSITFVIYYTFALNLMTLVDKLLLKYFSFQLRKDNDMNSGVQSQAIQGNGPNYLKRKKKKNNILFYMEISTLSRTGNELN